MRRAHGTAFTRLSSKSETIPMINGKKAGIAALSVILKLDKVNL